MSSNAFRFLTGAGLASGSAWWNANPPAASNPNPPNPSGAASNPNPPNASGAQSNANPPRPRSVHDGMARWPVPTLAPPPRVGLDPDWVYGSADTLLAQALRRSRARIVRDAGGPLTPQQQARAAVQGRPVKGSQLWRWASDFRIKATAAELMGRTQVCDAQLWVLEPVDGKAAQAHALFHAVDLGGGGLDGAGVDWDIQVDKTLRAATEREDRLPEILSQMDGFWPFYESLTGIPLDRTPALADLLGATHEWLLQVLMLMKHQIAALRPFQRSSLIGPLIATPGHGSLPSGHATTAAFTSELLCLMLYENPALYGQGDPTAQQRCAQLDALARRIAFNRVVAGVHFPIDSQVGYHLGRQLAHTVAALAGHTRQLPRPLTPKEVLGKPCELLEVAGRTALATPTRGRAVTAAETLQALWGEATAELGRVRV